MSEILNSGSTLLYCALNLHLRQVMGDSRQSHQATFCTSPIPYPPIQTTLHRSRSPGFLDGIPLHNVPPVHTDAAGSGLCASI